MSLINDQIQHDVQAKGTRAKARKGPKYKRAFDLALVVPAMIFLLPVLALIALGLLIVDGRPIFFKHRRIGADGEPFDCLKFRTMRRNSGEILVHLLATDPERAAEWKQCQKLTSDPRVHTLGKYLRITSADELPQMLNVLRGEMSVAGPRPVTEAELERYGAHVGYYLAMKPGITGAWQVSRRPGTSYEERVRLDIQYYHQRSLRTDIVIVIKTIGVVFFAMNES